MLNHNQSVIFSNAISMLLDTVTSLVFFIYKDSIFSYSSISAKVSYPCELSVVAPLKECDGIMHTNCI